MILTNVSRSLVSLGLNFFSSPTVVSNWPLWPVRKNQKKLGIIFMIHYWGGGFRRVIKPYGECVCVYEFVEIITESSLWRRELTCNRGLDTIEIRRVTRKCCRIRICRECVGFPLGNRYARNRVSVMCHRWKRCPFEHFLGGWLITYIYIGGNVLIGYYWAETAGWR